MKNYTSAENCFEQQLDMKSYASTPKNCTSANNPTSLQNLIYFTDILSNPNLSKVPPDVVLLGQQNGMVGLLSWPTYTHQEVIDIIDLLPTECTKDYDRAIFFIKVSNLLTIIYFYKIHKIYVYFPYLTHPPKPQIPFKSQ